MAETEATRLPRGRHSLTRDQVAQDQRDRILHALADAMVEEGYVATTVADVIARAGVSRETFYQQFASKRDCFTAAFDAAAAVLFARVVRSAEDGATSPARERFDRVIGAYLGALASEPAHARLFLVEVYAAGPEAIAGRLALQARIAAQLATLLELDADRDRFACEALVAAISVLVTGPVMAGDADALAALQDPLVDLVGRIVPT